MRHGKFKLLPSIFVFFLLTAWTFPENQVTSPGASSGYPLTRGNHDLEITVDNLKRTYILHVPPAIRDYIPMPLIVVLHGTYGTGRKMQLGVGFDRYADERGFLVAYPDAYTPPGEKESARWNDGRGTLESSYKNIDDVKFILAMIDDIATQVSLDRGRVYATGASNGGMMAYRLGCETDGVLSGIAPVIGAIPEPIFGTCNPISPLDFLAINGDKDPLVPFDGGEVCSKVPKIFCEKGRVVSQRESVNKFASANGCDAEPVSIMLPEIVNDGTTIEEQTYGNCSSGSRVTAYVIRNGGHTWPPLESQLPIGGKSTGNLDATKVIVDTFIGPAK